MKKCSKCKQEKEFKCFGKNKAQKDGYAHYCKDCCKLVYQNKKSWQSEYYKRYNQVNRDKKIESNRKYYEEHKEESLARMKSWQRRNKDKMRHYQNRWRSRKAGSFINHTEAEFNALLTAYQNKCYYCRTSLDSCHKDHYIPLSKGGNDTIMNIVPSCVSCNTSKSAKMPWVFKPGECTTPKRPEIWKLII